MVDKPQLKRSYAFTILPSEFIRDARLTHEAFRVYAVLCMHAPGGANENTTVFPDYERIKELTGIRHNHTIATRMRELEDAGWLERRKRFGASTIYTLTIPSPREPQSVTPRTNAHEDAVASPSRDALMHRVNHSPSPREPQSVTPSQTNKNKLTRTKKQESGAPARAAPAPPDQPLDESGSAEPQRRALYGDCFVAVARACAMDERVPMLAKRISVAAKYLAQREVDPECIAEFGTWWHANDWRGKRGDMPTPERVTELWLQFERRGQVAAVAQPAAPVSKYSSTQRRPQAMFTPEQRRAIEEQARRELEEEGVL
jgi:hypothetical protein